MGKLALVAFTIASICIVSTYGQSNTTSDAHDEDNCQILQGMLPLQHQRLVGVLRRALNIATSGPKPSKRARRADYDDEARHLLHFLTGDATYEATSSSESSQEQAPRQEPDEFCLPSTSFGQGRRTSLETMQRIVKMTDEGKSLATIQGKYKWYRRQYLNDFRKCVEEGGSHTMKRDRINKEVKKNVDHMLDSNLPLRPYMIRSFGRRAATANNATWFKASKRWMDSFRKANRLSSRKVTKKITRPRLANQHLIEESILNFYNDYVRLSRSFDRRAIWNIDQTGIEYEQSNERTIARVNSRDVYIMVDSSSKTTHSFTAQPIITRDGRLVGPLGLCMQEPSGQFGNLVRPRIERLEREFKNVKVYASKSGKMTTELMSQWMRDVLGPTIRQQLWRGEDNRSRIYQPDPEDIDSIAAIEPRIRSSCGTNDWVDRLLYRPPGYIDDCPYDSNFAAAYTVKHPYALIL